MSSADSLPELAARVVELARRAGASEAAATTDRIRDVGMDWRDGRVDGISEATQRSLLLEIYVDGRATSLTTSDLRTGALAELAARGVALARTLVPDADRRLPEPALYAGRAAVDLELEDAGQAALPADERKRLLASLEEAARGAPGAAAIISVTAYSSDRWREIDRVASNGFAGSRRLTAFSASTNVAVKEASGRRPEQFASAMARHRRDLPDLALIGRAAADRAIACLGAVKPKTGVYRVVVENRAARQLVGLLTAPLAGQALQQKRSFLEGKLGATIGSPLLTITDDPLLVRGMGSRTFDDEGLTARRRPIVEAGVLRDTYLDCYHARKLRAAPTSGTSSNLLWAPGSRRLDELMADVREGILVTAFVGGNSNRTTGDFSFGVLGARIRGGGRAEPLAEMNVAGNQQGLWKRLVAVGGDPFTWDGNLTPSLVFDGMQVAGA